MKSEFGLSAQNWKPGAILTPASRAHTVHFPKGFSLWETAITNGGCTLTPSYPKVVNRSTQRLSFGSNQAVGSESSKFVMFNKDKMSNVSTFVGTWLGMWWPSLSAAKTSKALFTPCKIITVPESHKQGSKGCNACWLQTCTVVKPARRGGVWTS